MIIIQSREAALEERILAILKREQIRAEQLSFRSQDTLTFAELTIDGRMQQVFLRGARLPLTRIEFDLLFFLACNAGNVLSKEELFCAVWGHDSEDTRKVVANTISNLRKKLGADDSARYIHTMPGGYLFAVS